MGDFMQKMQAMRIDSKYSLVRKIGEGGHGLVYIGKNWETGGQVALKLASRYGDVQTLEEEVDRYESFKGLLGFPEMYSYCSKDDYQIMVFELLGPSLEDLFVFCGHRFSLKTGLMILDQLLARFEALHSKGLLHRDIKPENFLMGTGENGNIIYMTDFGLCLELPKRLEEKEELAPKRSRLVGTTRYASIRGHTGQVQSQKDDLESLGYMMVYFLRGRLPWQGLKVRSRSEKEQLVLDKKMALDAEELCSELPQEFVEYMRYVKSLKRGQKPDYQWLRKLFQGVAQREEIEYDDVFDWTILVYFQQEEEKKAGQEGHQSE